jgi:hypothetical protein
MSISSDPNAWVIAALVFLLGLLVGMWLTAGGRRKWKGRYKAEVARREGAESERDRIERDLDEREKEWRERDSLRGAAAKDPRDPADDRPL